MELKFYPSHGGALLIETDSRDFLKLLKDRPDYTQLGELTYPNGTRSWQGLISPQAGKSIERQWVKFSQKSPVMVQ